MQTHQRTHLARLAACLLFPAFLSLGASAQISTFAVSMDGGQSGTGSPGTGFATVTLDESSGAVDVSGSYTGLNGNQSVAHIHGSAPIGGSAPTVLTLTGSGGTSGTLTGSGTFNATRIAAMKDGMQYINVHSSTNPGGEIRGHIVQLFNADCPAELPSDPALSDNAGNATIGPRIGHAVERFNLALDCTGSGAASLYIVELRLSKLTSPLTSKFGNLWISGPRLFSKIGMHGQGVVSLFPGAGLMLPTDLSFVGVSYTAQGFCGDPSSVGRNSNAVFQVVGI